MSQDAGVTGGGGGPPVRNSTLIAGLVSQLRAGEITNAQLWERLQSITSGSGGAGAAPSGGASAAAASAAPAPATSVAAPPVAAVPPPAAPRTSGGPAPPSVPSRASAVDAGDAEDGGASTGVANMAQEQRRELVQVRSWAGSCNRRQPSQHAHVHDCAWAVDWPAVACHVVLQ